MKSFFRTFSAVLLALSLPVAIAAIVLGVKANEKPKIKDGSYLIIDIYGEILEYNPPDDLMAELFGSAPETLYRILSNLEKAAVDDRIKGVIIKVSSNNSMGYASVEEMRGAIRRVREAGKPVYAFSDAINRKGLLLAAACDSIYMPPSGYLNFIGIAGTYAYLKGFLDMLDVRPNIHKIDEYKAAAEMVLRTDMSREARENRTWLINDMWDTQMRAFAEDRGLEEDRILELMEYALFPTDRAVEAGLIDHVRYWDDLVDGLKEEGDERLRVVSQGTYAKIKRSKVGLKGKKTIAVIHAQGQIGGRKNMIDPILGVIMGHESIRAELRRAGRDEDVVAVVLRVDSPGGESLASDLIGHEVGALAADKPVVVSMVDVAASGGYSVAYRGTKIIADPMTITGSIGSITGKMNMRGMYGKIGITFDHIAVGPNGLFWSDQSDFTPEQRRRLEEDHWEGFYRWLEDIAAEREMTVEELEGLAMGRVWTGNQAKENGLIDEVGGLHEAIQLAKELAEIDAGDDVNLVHYPKKKGLMELIGGGGVGRSAMRWAAYRYFREDLSQSVQWLMQRDLNVEGLEVE